MNARLTLRLLGGVACCALGLAPGVAPWPALADPQALSSFAPLQTQDALVVPPGSLTLQGTGVYTRDTNLQGRGSNLLNLTPTVKLGAYRGVQLDASVPYAVGSQSSAQQGSAGVDAYYQFTDPTPTFPALAVQAGYQWPYGSGVKSNQFFIRALATQWLGSSERAPRLHLNLEYTQVTNPVRTARRDVPAIGVAYSQLLTNKTALVLEIRHGANTSKNSNFTLLGTGILWEITDAWSASGGLNVGVGEKSPDYRVIFGLKRAFQLF